MFPLGTSDSGQRPKVRRFLYIVLPLEPPSSPVFEGAMHMEALVFSPIQKPPEKVLDDYCKFNGLDSSKFVCHPVVFAKGIRRDGKGTISIQRDGNGYRVGVRWRDGDNDGH